mgnify:CR=1 FL=1
MKKRRNKLVTLGMAAMMTAALMEKGDSGKLIKRHGEKHERHRVGSGKHEDGYGDGRRYNYDRHPDGYGYRHGS